MTLYVGPCTVLVCSSFGEIMLHGYFVYLQVGWKARLYHYCTLSPSPVMVHPC